MLRTYPIGITGPRRPESLRAILRRIERDLATDPARIARQNAILLPQRRTAF